MALGGVGGSLSCPPTMIERWRHVIKYRGVAAVPATEPEAEQWPSLLQGLQPNHWCHTCRGMGRPRPARPADGHGPGPAGTRARPHGDALRKVLFWTTLFTKALFQGFAPESQTLIGSHQSVGLLHIGHLKFKLHNNKNRDSTYYMPSSFKLQANVNPFYTHKGRCFLLLSSFTDEESEARREPQYLTQGYSPSRCGEM